jgi:hypothetical protein
MDMELEYHFFLAWYPALAIIKNPGEERRLHRWSVNMLPNPKSTYLVITRIETPAEKELRLAEIQAYIEYAEREAA